MDLCSNRVRELKSQLTRLIQASKDLEQKRSLINLKATVGQPKATLDLDFIDGLFEGSDPDVSVYFSAVNAVFVAVMLACAVMWYKLD